jgi:hypothetical protein
MNLLKSDDAYLIKLLDLLKMILIEDKNDFNESTINGVMHEIADLIKIEPLKPNSLFEKYYKKISETVFEIFLKCKRNEARLICRIFFREINDILSKMKKHDKDFQLFLINKTHEIAIFMKNLEDPTDHTDKNPVDIFADLCYWIADYIKNHCNMRVFSLPCINLVISWLQLSSNAKFISLAGCILRKESFFAFVDYPDKLIEILNILIQLAQTIPEKYEEKELRTFMDPLKDCIENVSKYLKPNPALMTLTQPIIFKDLIAKAIIENNEDENYFTIIRYFTELLDFKYLSNKQQDLSFIKTVVSHAVSTEIIETIQPEIKKDYDPRNLFYLNFFTKLSHTYETRQDIANEIETEIRSLLVTIDEFNNYDDVISPGNLTINFRIFNTFIYQIGLQNVSYKSMAHFITPILIKIYTKHKDINDVRSTLTFFLSQITIKNADVLAKYATQIWQLYFQEKKSTAFIHALNSIVPLSVSAFTKDYANEYFSFILSDEVNDTTLVTHFFLIQTISKFIPKCLFEKQSSGTAVISSLILKIKNFKNGLLYYYIVDTYSKLTADGEIIEELYELRHEIFSLLFMSDLNELKRIASLNNLEVSTYLYLLSTALGNISVKISDDKNYSKNRLLIVELVGFSEKYRDKAEVFINTIKNIATTTDKIFLLKEYKVYFQNIKNTSDGNLKKATTYLCDLIEGRNLEKIEQKIDTNTENINMLKADIEEADGKVDSLTNTVQSQETEIKSVVKNVNSKLEAVDQRLDQQDKLISDIDDKTLLNIPLWAKEIAPIVAKEWILIAKRLNFSQNDINSWNTQAEPFMATLQEWFTINKSSEATVGLIKVLKEMNQMECVDIIENELKKSADEIPNDDLIDAQLVSSPPQIFLSFQWSLKDKAEILIKYLENEGFTCWADFGQFGGGDSRNKRIDRGLRAASVLVCFVTSDYAKDETGLNQVNLAVTLGKPIVPLLAEKLKWPPVGSLGPILSGYLFVRFYQRPNELTNDERYWPADKLDELLMQLRQVVPSRLAIPAIVTSNPVIFISYQWGKQKEIINLYTRLVSFGLTCWLDIKEMSGGDTLYEKIDTGIRNCHVMISCVTEKYGLSANCRKEVLLADSINKPIIPLLLESGILYPPAGPLGPILGSLKFIDFTKDLNEQNTWKGDRFNEMMERLKINLPDDIVNEVENKIPDAVRNSKACILS